MNNLLTALNAAMAACGYVQKTGQNNFHKYSYASEADLVESIRPALVENGLMLIGNQRRVWTDGSRTFVKIDYTLYHTSGESLGPIGAIGEAMDKGDKATYKSITGAHKYLLYKLMLIATGDDPENDAAEAPEPTPAPAQPRQQPARQPESAATGFVWDSSHTGQSFNATAVAGQHNNQSLKQPKPFVIFRLKMDNGLQTSVKYYGVKKVNEQIDDLDSFDGTVKFTARVPAAGGVIIAEHMEFNQ